MHTGTAPCSPPPAAAKPRVRRGLAATLCSLLICAVSGCAEIHRPRQGEGCWTRASVAEAAQADAPLAGLRLGEYHGEEAVPDPDNWWTGLRFTGRACRMRVFRDAAGQAFAEASFLPRPVALVIPMSSADFYMGLVDEDSVLIVQQYPGGLSATHTRFDERGFLNYTDCSADGFFIRECHTPPR